MQDFRGLEVWRKSHALALQVYQITRGFPVEERYGLTSQLRRGSSSVPANIAEGCGRNSRSELKRFLVIAMGSASETEYYFLLSHDLGILTTADHNWLNDKICEVKRMLASFISKLSSDD